MSIAQADKLSKPQRDSNFELFRIVLMLAIIAHHYVVNSGLNSVMDQCADFSRVFPVKVLGAWGKTGIDCFLMITGYFMCKSHITVEKFLKLLSEVVFYNIVIGFLFIIAGRIPLTIKSIVDIFLPFRLFSKKFSVCFLAFYLCIPFLNIVLNNIGKSLHRNLLILLLSLYVLMPSIRSTWEIGFNYVTWFCVVYILAAYIRMYPGRWSTGAAKWGIISLCCVAVAIFSIYTRALFYLEDSNKILAVLVALSLFLFFKNLRMHYSPFINWTAQSIFGVLLIHANCGAMRQWLWGDTLHVANMFYSPYFWLHAVCSVLGVFIVCTLLDHLRITWIERPFFQHFKLVIKHAEIAIYKYLEL